MDKQDLAKLVTLQEQDKLIDSMRAAIDLIPQDIAAIRAEFEGEKTRLDGSREKAKNIQLKKKEKELELSQKEEAARKHSQELNLVKTNEAFKALQKEIDKAKAEAGQIETDILMLMEEADAVSKEEKVLAGEIKKIEADVQARIKALEDRKAAQETQLAAEKSRREASTQGIPADLLSLYEQTRTRRKGVAVSRMRDNMCDVCHILLTPQTVVNVRKGTKVMVCESCQRILYCLESAPAKA